MKLPIKKLHIIFSGIIFLIILADNKTIAQNDSRDTKKVSLEELYAIPNNQLAWLHSNNTLQDIFFCNPGELDNLSISYFIYALKRNAKTILQIKRNVQTNILTVICAAKTMNEKELHESVDKVRAEIAEIFRTSKNPHATMEERAAQ